MVTAAWLAVKTFLAGNLFATAKVWAGYALVTAVAALAVWFMASTFNLVRENEALRKRVATFEAAQQARELVDAIEAKAVADYAEAERNNAKVLEGWQGVIVHAPEVNSCVTGDTLIRLRGLQ